MRVKRVDYQWIKQSFTLALTQCVHFTGLVKLCDGFLGLTHIDFSFETQPPVEQRFRPVFGSFYCF